MSSGDSLIRVYAGTEVLVLALKAFLEENGIGALVQNDFQAGLNVGAFMSTSSSIDLYVKEENLEKAKPILEVFIRNNPV